MSNMNLNDFKELIENGNIAFYKSCEITEIFLFKKKEKIIYNLFTLAVFEEKEFKGAEDLFLNKKLINIDDYYSFGICRYYLDISEAKSKFEELNNKNSWGRNGVNSTFPKLKSLPKQYISSEENKRLNKILKNNFHQGSYILEFFDDEKTNIDFLLKMNYLNKFNTICEKINDIIPIDLSIVRDRIGNFIFQFPITIVDINTTALKTWDGINAKFSWHNKLDLIPDCLIQLESKFDDNYMGCKIEEYNKQAEHIVKIGNLDQKIEFKVWRKEPSLILSCFKGSFIRDFDLNMGIMNHNKRLFEINGVQYEVEVSNSQKSSSSIKKITYETYINSNLYEVEKKQLEKSLSFKQYKGVNNEVALNDIRKLIQLYDKNGVYLWDPYLRANDVFKTLYFSRTAGVELRAIASTNSNTANVFAEKGITPFQVINNEKVLFENPNNDNLGLNFEFRLQNGTYGWKFHDRFLIFPGDEFNKPKVYALGTSINSYGNEHNILQVVSHPQPVVDAFNELWNQLNNQQCLIWKFPNI